ncbi:MAG: hypothetical protein M3P50_12045, partial [Actinomycetota bacterium]|nr:hypothetical protein [Actinomycetota bacterium]
MTPTRTFLALLALVAIAAGGDPARAASAPDAGRAFEPAPVSQAEFDTKPPSDDPATQRHFTTAADGTRIFTETWL